VDPVLIGKVRAKQYYSDDHDRTRNLGVLLHGDGSFAGQGVVYETLDMSALPDYTVGGAIHIVVNNQVGHDCCQGFCDRLRVWRVWQTVCRVRDLGHEGIA
jgi:2-oxoglutarate dehydrogenase complex dehydrogenase (E1) component-like enzyme